MHLKINTPTHLSTTILILIILVTKEKECHLLCSRQHRLVLD